MAYGIDHRRRSRRSGVWKAVCSTRTTRDSKLLWRRRCVASSMLLEPTCNADFLFFWGPVNFFFWKPCRSNRGPSRNPGWVYRNWGPFEEICWAQTKKLGHGGGFRKREHKAFCMLTCMVPGQLLVRLSSWDEANTGLGKRCKWRLVFGCVCTLTRVSIETRKRAKILKIISQKTDQLFLVNPRPFPEQSSSIATCRVGSI